MARIVSATPPKNIVFVTIESLSSSHMAHGGTTRGLTPNLDRLADEHLYDYALEQMDRDAASGKPFLTHLMTTSNHTSFTFPDGRIDLPRGRPGAVKYSDYAVGRFIEQARGKPWFKDTLFVLVADHCASSKGRVSLPPENDHIPAILYSPAHVAPLADNRLASQIDLVPTVLDLLGLPEHTRFMERSVLHAYPDAGRAIGAYQETARRARDGLLRHVNLPDDLRMR